ncbi:MAG: TRAP transporter substrate-binding protein [Pseudomonadota bacterium]
MTDTHKISRRALFTAGGAAAAASALAAPAIASDTTRTIRLATSWPRALRGIGTGALRVADTITRASGGRLKVDVYSAGELTTPFGVHDAAGAGECEMYHACEYYWQGKHRGFNFFTTVPFGLTTIEHVGWITAGGGRALWDELNSAHNIKAFMAGSTGVQMGGWFDKEISSMADFEGLTMRMPGLGGQVLAAVGANPVVLPGGGIVEALFDKSIDATEWVGPYNDMQFGFQKILAKYMYPGFHEPGTITSLGINLDFWNSLSEADQALIEMVCDAEVALMFADYNGNNTLSLTQLVDEFAVEPTRLPDDVWNALAETSHKVVSGVAEDDDLARRIYESFDAYRTMMMAAPVASSSEYLVRRSTGDLLQFI